MQIDLTDACNQSCIVCWLHAPDLKTRNKERVERQATLPWETYISLLDELRALETSEIYFAGGGEPLVHPRAWDALDAAVERGFTTSLHTNFSLVDEEGVGRILELGLHHVTVSLWAGTAETYLATHPGAEAGDFERITERLKALNDTRVDRPITKLYHVLTTHNAHELLEMFQLAEDLGCDAVEFAVAEVLPGATDAHGLRPEQAETIAGQLSRWEKRAPWRRPRMLGREALEARLHAIAGGQASDVGLVHELPCFAGWTYSRVMADGRVIPCLKAHRIPSGHLDEQGFTEIWRGARQAKFREAGRPRRKQHPLFAQVGNEEDVACGCERGCDNLAQNHQTAQRLSSLSRPERALLRLASSRAARSRREGSPE